MKKHCFWVIVLAIGVLGCKEEEKPKPVVPAPAPKPKVRPKFDPKFKISIEPNSANPPHYIVKWTAGVNTGGWKLSVDSARVEDKHRELRAAEIYTTLEEPGEAEAVTEAMETLSGEYDAGTQKVDKAEIFYRRTMRGRVENWAPSYGFGATAGKQW
jgi:hypothetical protein